MTQINIPVLCIMLVAFLPSPSQGHSDFVPNPLSAHAPKVTHRITACPRAVLAVTYRAHPVLEQVAVIHWCRYHAEEWRTTGLECVWARSLLSLPSIFQKLWRNSAFLLLKISNQDQEVLQLRLPTNGAGSTVCLIPVWFRVRAIDHNDPFYLLYLDHQRIAVWFQHSSKPDS